MAEKTKSCIKCNGTMSFRLGEFTCDQCGHVEQAKVEQQQRGPAGPGFQSGQQWGGQSSGQQPGYGAAPPPTGTLYTPGQLSGGGRVSVGGSEGNPITTTEYVLIGCLAYFIPIAGLIFGYIWSGQNRQGADGCLSAAWVWFGFNVIVFIIAFFAGLNGAEFPF